jgi:hypothetical protein
VYSEASHVAQFQFLEQRCGGYGTGTYVPVQAVELRTKTTYGLGPCVHRAGSGSESIDTTLIGLRTMTSCV